MDASILQIATIENRGRRIVVPDNFAIVADGEKRVGEGIEKASNFATMPFRSRLIPLPKLSLPFLPMPGIFLMSPMRAIKNDSENKGDAEGEVGHSISRI